jgi:putative transposase
MPGTGFGVHKRAARESWPSRKKQGRGGGREYPATCLPQETRDALFHTLIESAPALPTTATNASIAAPINATPAAVPSIASLTDRQRDVVAARSALVEETRRIGAVIGTDRAVCNIIRLAAAGELPEHLQRLVPIANVKRGKNGSRTLCRRSLYRWIEKSKSGIGALAPADSGRDYTLSDDVAAVLAMYRGSPNKLSLAWCAKEVATRLGVDEQALYHRANRYRKKIPRSVFYVGRHTGSALKALQPFRRREFLSLNPNDVWTGDGHGAKLTIAHPITGSRFAPEVTVILDVATRYAVGWSVSLSENCLAIADALRHGVSEHGVPLIYYSDNGGGQKNKMLDAPITGTLGTLGVHHETGIPGNAQGRGVIERFWKTVLITLAQRFPTFQGKSADRDTLRLVSREIDRTLRAAKKGEVIALPVKLPTWQQFIEAVEAAIYDYNHNHRHSSLPKLDGKRHATPAEYRAARLAGADIHKPTGAELATLFMPAVLRKANRGEVQLFNGIYFHKDLMLVDGEDVQVCFNIHDASRVWCKKLTGEFIAEAVLDGNRSGYFPKPFIERLQEDRTKRRMARLHGQMDEAQAELRGSLEYQPGAYLEPIEFPAPELVENVVSLPGHAARRPMFDSDAEKYRWLLTHRGDIATEDDNWINWYRTTSEWLDLFGDGGRVPDGDDFEMAARV